MGGALIAALFREFCLSEHPDDWGPIRRRCNLAPHDDGPHEYRSVIYSKVLVDVWEGEK